MISTVRGHICHLYQAVVHSFTPLSCACSFAVAAFFVSIFQNLKRKKRDSYKSLYEKIHLISNSMICSQTKKIKVVAQNSAVFPPLSGEKRSLVLSKAYSRFKIDRHRDKEFDADPWPEWLKTLTPTDRLIIETDWVENFVPQKIPDMNQDTYQHLNAAEKAHYRELFETKNHVKVFFQEHIGEFFAKKEEIFAKHAEGENVFSLGQTPAWFHELNYLQNSETKRGEQIAFSGTWHHLPYLNDPTKCGIFIDQNERDQGELNPTLFPKDYKIPSSLLLEENQLHKPSREAIFNYRIYLKKLGFDPQTLIKRWKIEGKQTVLIDYAQTLKGMKSFLSILKQWAQEENIESFFKQAIKIHILYSKGDTLAYEDYKSYIHFNLKEFVENSFKQVLFTKLCDQITIDEPDLSSLLATKEKGRLVPSYPFKKWIQYPLNPPYQFPRLKTNNRLNLIRFQILDQLAKKSS